LLIPQRELSAVNEALIIDANDARRVRLSTLLGAEGWVATHARTLGEARLQLCMRPVVAVFAPWTLPDARGVQLLDQLCGGEFSVVLTDVGAVADGAEAIRRGACDVLLEPVEPRRLRDVLARIEQARGARREVALLREQLRELGRFGPLVGASSAMEALFDLIRRVGPGDGPLCVTGERGSGKRLVAQAVHAFSRRAQTRLVAVDCASSDCEAELFGASTGGNGNGDGGALGDARGATLLLCHVDRLSEALQQRLAAALQRLAASVPSQSPRLLATVQQPAEEVLRGKPLRADLWEHVQGGPIDVPPLRQRPSDIALLADHFLQRLIRLHGVVKRWSPGALRALEHWRWPGNVRELQEAVRRGFSAEGTQLTVSGAGDEPTLVAAPRAGDAESESVVVRVGSSIADAEHRLVVATLAHCGGNKQRASQILGISLKTLYNRLSAYRDAEMPRATEPRFHAARAALED
jgi:DNA-binding NtrC family response regulator